MGGGKASLRAGFYFGWFWTLRRPYNGGVLRDLLLGWWRLKRTHLMHACAEGYLFSRSKIGSFICSHSNKTRGHFYKTRGHSNIGGVYSNKTRQKQTLFCASQHAPTRKVAWESRFCPQNALFLHLFRHLPLPRLYIHRQRERWRRRPRHVSVAIPTDTWYPKHPSNTPNRKTSHASSTDYRPVHTGR